MVVRTLIAPERRGRKLTSERAALSATTTHLELGSCYTPAYRGTNNEQGARADGREEGGVQIGEDRGQLR